MAAGSSPQGRRIVPGELVWIPLPCGRAGCSCTADFTGAATRGITDVARVRTMPGSSRSSVRRALTAAMCPDCIPRAQAPTEAEKLLRFAAGLPDGTLVRRDERGRLTALPPGTSLTLDGDLVPPETER